MDDQQPVQFDLRSAQFRNELWLLLESYRDLHGPTMAGIFDEFSKHAQTDINDLPGDEFHQDNVSTDNAISSLQAKFDSIRDNRFYQE